MANMKQNNRNTDRINNLPAPVIDQILSLIPLKDAVRTSILSRDWRYKWTKIPHLVFDDQCVSPEDKIKFIHIVDGALLIHDGPIHSFKLSRIDLAGVSDIDTHINRWILNVSTKSIGKLQLDIWVGRLYKVPSSLFSCESLIELQLHLCELKPPSTFKGFKNLKRISLFCIELGQDVLENLITSCPMLHMLMLLRFNANLPNEFLYPCANMKVIIIDMNFRVALCLLRSCPNVKYLQIIGSLNRNTDVDFSKTGDPWNFKLREVRILGISGTRSELDFINFLLSNSPVLEKITVQPVSNDAGLKLLKELVSVRQSSVAKITYLDP